MVPLYLFFVSVAGILLIISDNYIIKIKRIAMFACLEQTGFYCQAYKRFIHVIGIVNQMNNSFVCNIFGGSLFQTLAYIFNSISRRDFVKKLILIFSLEYFN